MQGLFSFNGRLNRAKFWLILIVTDIAMFVLLGILVAVTGGSMTMGADGSMPAMGGGGPTNSTAARPAIQAASAALREAWSRRS